MLQKLEMQELVLLVFRQLESLLYLATWLVYTVKLLHMNLLL